MIHIHLKQRVKKDLKYQNIQSLFLKQSKKMKAFIELEEQFLALRANYRN